jgi:glycosyltransferase involved in cell wall biosynthesis
MDERTNVAAAQAARAPAVSVAMPVYNGAAHLSESIESILAQTFDDFELIIIDDGSADDSLRVLREYEKRDQRIRLVSRENRNLATTLNDIIALARGKWIARMDQDDIALPQRFARQLHLLEASGADICGCRVRLFGAADQRELVYPVTDAAIKAELLFASPFAHPTVMMRASLAKSLLYDKVWEKCEDYDLWERAANAGWRMANLDEVMLLYRQHPSQITTNTAGINHMLAQKIRRRYWTRMAASLGVDPRSADQVLRIRDVSGGTIDLDLVDRAFEGVLASVNAATRPGLFRHMSNLYFLLAGHHRDVAGRWSRLNKKFTLGGSRKTYAQLWLLGRLRVRSDSAAYRRLKSGYVYVVSRMRS